MPTLFLYGDQTTRPPIVAWLESVPTRPAWTRGTLWRAGRPTRVLVPGTGADRVPGVLIDLDEPRLHVLDLLLGGAGVTRRTIPAAVGLRPVPAEAWVLADARVAHHEGYQPVRRR